ncbi:MAG: hypothetical protein PVJ53_00665 [Desulfobacterales bacterium]|jgi:hypothetical protein
MKFRDFFLPKIAHSNPDVRIAAIKDEENVELLKNVIKNDSEPRVVECAKMRIEELGETAV